jgi:hypothetical protein
MSEHTPGPWEVFSYHNEPVGKWPGIDAKESKQSIVLYANNDDEEHGNGVHGKTFNQALANARRIARVPDMEATILAQAATIEALRARVKAADAVAVMLENCLEVLTKEDGRLCCNGRECGCYGATKHQEAEHYANEALAAYRATGGAE